MTYDGFCAVALAGTFVMLIAVTVGWTVDNWAGWRDDWRRARADRDAIRYCRLPAAHFGPCDEVVVRVADPSPRVRRLVDNGIREQNREAAWRARAERENL